MNQTQPERALCARAHLACVNGPDRGSIVALDQPTSIGRQGEFVLVDRASSRLHCHIRPALVRGRAVGYLTDNHPTNPTLVEGRRVSGETPLHPGHVIQIGHSTWQVRSRPLDLTWPLPKEANSTRRQMPWLRLLPLLFLAMMVWRLTHPPLWTVVSILASCVPLTLLVAWKRRSSKRRRYDPAFLALALQARLATAIVASQNQLPTSWVWIGPVGGKRMEIGPHQHLGFAGQGGRSLARWVTAQFIVQNPYVTWSETQNEDQEHPHIWIKGPNDKEAAHDNTIVVAWAEQPHLLPPEVTRIVNAKPHASPSWLPPASKSAGKGIGLPTRISFPDIGCSVTTQEILRRWQCFDIRRTTWSVPVGVGTEHGKPKVITMGLVENGPHTLMAGGTGAGKSVALRTWITSLCATIPPDHLRIVLVDYKGGAGLGPVSHFPHVERFHTDLDASETAWMLRRLRLILMQRKDLLREANHTDISEWERVGGAPPRLFIVIDEFQALVEEHPQLLTALSRLASQGRSLGIHLVLATQHPGPAVNAALKATLDQRVALRCNEATDSLAVLGTPDAAKLPRQPGVALLNSQAFQFAHAEDVILPQSVFPVPDPIWPMQLPTTGPEAIPGLIGIMETEQGPTQNLYWDRAPLAIIGNAMVREEIWHLSRALAINAEADFSFALGTASHGFTADYSLDNPGDMALFLSRIHKHKSATIWVSEIAAILRELDGLGVGAQATRAWTRLVREGLTKDLHIVVSDSEGHSSLNRIPQRLLRIPNLQAWSDPSLLRLLPPLSEFRAEANDPHALSREEATSATAMRFLADGVNGTPRRVAVQAINCISDVTSRRIQNEPCSDELLPLSSRPSISSSDLEGIPIIKENGWLQALQAAGNTFAIIEPTIEMIRHLAIRFPDDAMWLKAYHPFDHDTGILAACGQIDPCRFRNE